MAWTPPARLAPKTCFVVMRLTRGERARFRRAARRDGLALSAYMRVAVEAWTEQRDDVHKARQ